jgi:CRP-like cAMP-binding protein
MSKQQMDIRKGKGAIAGFFPFMKPQDIEELFAICQYKSFKNREIIFSSGLTHRKVALILSGYIRGYIIDSEGDEKNIILKAEGTFVGVPEGLFSSNPTKYNFEAIMDCDLLVFNLTDLEALAKINSAIFELYTWGLKDNIATMLGRIESMVMLTPEERYQNLLKKYPHFFQAVFHKHIANYLGITPVSLSRIIKRLKDHG